MNGRTISGLTLLAVLICAMPSHTDEIRLKDGSKIIGTIVGFENDSFRVETPYGFALVRKDKVADINITAPKKESEPISKADAPAAPKKEPDPKPKSNAPAVAATAPAIVPAVAKESSSPVNVSPEANAMAPERPAIGANTSASAAKSPAIGAKNGIKSEKPGAARSCPEGSICDPGESVGLMPPPHPSASPVDVEPTAIRDEIHGNLYFNFTYGFQMYKPPSWDLIPAARKALPDAVAALGTYDQTTLLVIGREHVKDSLDAHAAATGKALSGVYENYRLISNNHVTIAGFPAIEQRLRGTADGRDWSVVLVTFLKGNDAFTLLGMTWADSDLIQMQENVIAKAVNSLTFVAQ